MKEEETKLKNIEKCKEKYVVGNEMDYVTCVYSEVRKYERDKKLAARGMKALLRLAQRKGPSTPITIDELAEESGLPPKFSVGMWPWLQAGIVGYVIRDDFYSAIEKVLGERD